MSSTSFNDQAENRSALVTGATSGIGRALCRQLADEGVRVFATGRDRQRLEEVMRETGCRGAPFDLSEPDAPTRLYTAALEALEGAPDVLINNAGYNSRKAKFVDVEEAEFDAQWMVNLRAPALLCRQALRDMSARGSGHIVNVLSTVVHLGIETMGAYSAMKSGFNGLTKVLIKEGREAGVKVTAVHPGGTDTNFREKERPDYLKPEVLRR